MCFTQYLNRIFPSKAVSGIALGLIGILGAASSSSAADCEWRSLFNGKDLKDWTVKIRGYEVGDNFANTFRVEDGLMKVRYDGYDEFKASYGHIFFNESFSHYKLRIEYRFVNEQCKGGPGWAFRNSGAMLHCQDPKSMTKDQEFPVSIEAQFLGGDGKNPRTTSNLCTPGTNVVMDDKLVTRHCTTSTSETYHGDQWVTVELEVRGGEVIRHWIDGKLVLTYDKPQYDPNDGDAKKLIKGDNLIIDSGYISLQSESHPCDFRKVEILDLTKN